MDDAQRALKRAKQRTAFREVLGEVNFPGLDIWLDNEDDRFFLYVADPDGTCNVTGDPFPWKGRKWLLSPHMTRSEIVLTAFKAVMTAIEHETREKFQYRGRAILGPHLDVEKLWELAGLPDAEDVREPPPPEPHEIQPCPNCGERRYDCERDDCLPF